MISKEKIKQIKQNKYIVIVNKDGLQNVYFCDNEKSLNAFINGRNLKHDEYVKLINPKVLEA